MLKSLGLGRLCRPNAIRSRKYCIKYVQHQFTEADARVIFNEERNSFSATEIHKTHNQEGIIIPAYVPYYGCYAKFNLRYRARYTISTPVTIETDKGSNMATVNIKFGMDGSLDNSLYHNNDRVYGGCEFPQRFMSEMFSGLDIVKNLRDLDLSVYNCSIEKYALDIDNAKEKFVGKFNDYVEKLIKSDVNLRVENNGIDIKDIKKDVTEFVIYRYLLPIYIYYDTDGNAMFIQALYKFNVEVYGHNKLSVSKMSLITGGLTLAALAWTPIGVTGLALFIARFLIFASVTSTAGFLAKHKQHFMNKMEDNNIAAYKHALGEQISKNAKFNKELITDNKTCVSFKMTPRLLKCSNYSDTNKIKRKYVRTNQLNKSTCLKLLKIDKACILTQDIINYQYNKCILELQHNNSVTTNIYKLKLERLEKAKNYLLNYI